MADRARQDFDPLGVRLNGFRLDAAAELGIGYDDNLFGTSQNRESDGFASLGAQGSVLSDWSTHAVGVTGRVENRRYYDNGSLDWTDYAIGGFGRYDVTPNTSVELRLNRVQEHLAVDDVDVQQGGLSRPVPYAYNEAQLQGTTRFNRLGVVLLGNWRGYSYDDVTRARRPPPGSRARVTSRGSTSTLPSSPSA